MRQNEHPVTGAHLIGSYRCKHDGLAGAGRQHQQGAGVAVLPLGVDAFTGLLLVGAQGLCLGHLERPLCPALSGCSFGFGRRQKALHLIALAGLTCMRAALLGVLPDAQLADAFGTHDLVPAGAEGLAPLALTDALKESPQQALRFSVQVQAVGDGGITLAPPKIFRVSFAMEQGGSFALPSKRARSMPVTSKAYSPSGRSTNSCCSLVNSSSQLRARSVVFISFISNYSFYYKNSFSHAYTCQLPP